MRFIEFVGKYDKEMWDNSKPEKVLWDKTSDPRDPKDFRPTPKDKLAKPNSAANLKNIGPGAAGSDISVSSPHRNKGVSTPGTPGRPS